LNPKALLALLLAISAAILLVLAYRSGSRSRVTNPDLTPFSGAKAFSHVEQLVALGPRSIGSESIAEARGYIREYLEGLGLEIIGYAFNASYEGQEYHMENIIGVLPGRRDGVIAVGGHYDTKEIPGANDGGSSAGLLLEMARVLKDLRLEHTVWVIFFDGEDTGSNAATMFYGSRNLAGRLEAEGRKPRLLILADMIGDKDLSIRRDRNSDPSLTDHIWSKAEELGYGDHFSDGKLSVLDDHVPFMNIGVPSCVLIDFSYGPLNSYWHTSKDDMDKISEESLKIVGDVIYSSLVDLDEGSGPS
jgi:glutaminyl-peptide cyclotransferase